MRSQCRIFECQTLWYVKLPRGFEGLNYKNWVFYPPLHQRGQVVNTAYQPTSGVSWVRDRLKCDGTRWCMGGEVKGKLANVVGSQYPSLPRSLVYTALLPLMRTPRLPEVDWTDAPADLNWLVRFAERQNLVSARVPLHFKRSLPHPNFQESFNLRSFRQRDWRWVAGWLM